MATVKQIARGPIGLLLVAVLLLSGFGARATHIVGGELNYVYLGNDSVYVKIKVYRDSLNADPYFDNPMRLYVYDETGDYRTTYLIPLPDVKLEIPQIEDSCFVEPPEVLVDYVVYEDTLYIPGLQPGYTLAYFRCCRNDRILNIQSVDFLDGDTVGGELTGAIYPAEFPDWTLNNANPEYVTFPPVAICADKRLEYDHSAIDPDGDSLVYELCTPYTGGNEEFVFGIPDLQEPPFQEVLFIPPYGLNNVMGGVPLHIDPQTGLLTAVPNTLGRFVIAVCVNEYRDGQFLARHRRDFQFNVVPCDKVYGADFSVAPAPKIDTLSPFDFLVCDTTLTKQFFADLAEPAPVLWDFGDGTVSSELNPVHTFPATGAYSVTLIAGPGEYCADTMIKVIDLQRHVTGVDFSFEQDACATVDIPVQFNPAGETSEPIVFWQWDFGDGSFSNQQDPLHLYQSADSFLVNLLATAASGCCAEAEQWVTAFVTGPASLPDTLAICSEDSIRLPLEAPPGSVFLWSPSAGLDDVTAQQPLVFPGVNTAYTVQVLTPTGGGDTCRRELTCMVLAEDVVPDISVEESGGACDRQVVLTASASSAWEVSWFWAADAAFDSVLATGPVLDVLLPESAATYYVQAANRFCTAVQAVPVSRGFIDIAQEDIVVCGLGDTNIPVDYQVVSASPYTLLWTIADSVVETYDPLIWPLGPGVVPVTVVAVNDGGCRDTVLFRVITFALPDVAATAVPRTVEPGEAVQLEATGEPDYAYAWSPPGLLNDATLPAPLAYPEATTVFAVSVTDTNGCTAQDTALVLVVELPCEAGSLFIPNAFSPNGDGLNDVFRVRSSGDVAWELSVYDRWGNLVFRGREDGEGWDGAFNGEPLPADAYGYYLEAECPGDGQDFTRQGNVTLIR